MKALVLSGGGSKGAFQAGAISYLLAKQKCVYDLYAGISVGAINAAFLSMYKTGEEFAAADALKTIWSSIDNSRIYKSRYPFLGKKLSAALSALSSLSLYDSTPLHNLIYKYLSVDRLRASHKQLCVGAVNLNTGEKRYWTEQSDDIVEAVIASSSFPGFFIPGNIDGDIWTDGGVKDIAPISQSIRLGATEIDVIMASPKGIGRIDASKMNVISAAPHILDYMSDEIMQADVAISSYIGAANGLKLRVIYPEVMIQHDALDFDPIKIQKNIAHGFNVVEKLYV